MRKCECKQHQWQQHHQHHFDGFVDKWNDLLLMAFSNHVANQCIHRSRKCRTRNHQQNVKTSSDVCDCQRSFAKPFNKNKEHKPRGNGNKILKHDEYGQAQNFPNGLKINFFEFEKVENVFVFHFQRYQNQVNERSQLCDS